MRFVIIVSGLTILPARMTAPELQSISEMTSRTIMVVLDFSRPEMNSSFALLLILLYSTFIASAGAVVSALSTMQITVQPTVSILEAVMKYSVLSTGTSLTSVSPFMAFVTKNPSLAQKDMRRSRALSET